MGWGDGEETLEIPEGEAASPIPYLHLLWVPHPLGPGAAPGQVLSMLIALRPPSHSRCLFCPVRR